MYRHFLNFLLCYLLYVHGLAAVLNASAHETLSHDDVLTEETDAFINQVLADWNSPGGVAVAVVRRNNDGGWDVESKGYGIANLNGTKVTPNTRFSIGSNSKLFTTLATGLLINNKTLSSRLDWTTKIDSIIPDWGLENPVGSCRATIIDLMSHRTGMPRHDYSYKWSDDIPTIIKNMKFLRPSAEFRDVRQYTNSMYTVLSYLPTVLLPSKPPFARYVKEHIFDPLGMASTTYSYDRAYESGQLADGMTRRNGTVRVLPYFSQIGGEDGNIMSGGAGIISNAIDMSIWLQTLLLDGVKPGTNESVIPASIIQKVSTGISVESPVARFPELSPVVYGGGQSRSAYRGHELIEHGGDVTGFHSQITRLPYDGLGIAVLTNDELYGDWIREVIKGRLLDEALGLEKIDWNTRLKAIGTIPLPPATPRPANASHPDVTFTSLTGPYHNSGYGGFELCLVSSNDNSASPSCNALATKVSTILPGEINPNIPTFLSEWNSPWGSYVKVAHFNGNIFNISFVSSHPTGNTSEPYWSWTLADPSRDTLRLAEVSTDGHSIGIGFWGIWGAGDGIPGPQGKTARSRAEVWFDRV